MSQFENPYAANYNTPYLEPVPSQDRLRLADLGKRFFGALVDGFAGLVYVIPGLAFVVADILIDPNRPNPGPFAWVGFGLMLVGTLALFVTQILLLVYRSQTIGKYLMKTQIVDVQTLQPAGFVQSGLLRIFVNGLIAGIPCIGPIYSLVDVLFIFGDERRCIHDLIAGTYVVDIS